jgi:DnaJ-class molecular chaperone
MKFFRSNDIGDLIITLNIDVPKEIDEETEEILNKLKEKLSK